MQVRNATETGFDAQIDIIPAWAWTLAVIAFVTAQIYCNLFMGRQADAPPAWQRALLGLLAGVISGFYFLCLGYINRDARQRGMSPVLWTLVAIFIPNCLGILLYFILRQPLRITCPQCADAVQAGFNYCPRCSCKLSPNCPQCQRVVSASDVYCPHCGTLLRSETKQSPAS